MRRCGVCFVVVHGRVEGVGLENTGVLNDGSRSGQSGTLDLGAAFSAWGDRSSSELVVPTCECVCSTALGKRDAGPSSVCLSAMSNCRKPNASLLYLASSAPRLGPEKWTKISIGGTIVPLHLEKNFVVWVSGLYLYEINLVLCKCNLASAISASAHLQ